MKDMVKNLEKQIVHTTSLFAKDEKFNDERFMKVRIAAMHTGINRNKSRFTKEVVEAAKSTFANIPVLADVKEYTDEEGNKFLDYSGHSMHIEEDAFNKDAQRVIYDERVVGIVPEVNNFELVFDEEAQNYYVYVDALLYREYGNYCCDVLESRNNQTEVSMEIGCEDVAYSTSDNCLDVGAMTAYAVTLLGQKVSPGMAKAHATAFSLDDESKQAQLVQIMQELKQALDNYTNFISNNEDSIGKEDVIMKNDAEIMEVVENEEVQEEQTEVEDVETVTEDTEVEDEDIDEVEDAEDTEENFEEAQTLTLSKNTMENGNLELRYEISHEDLRCALYKIIEQYDELDNEYYFIRNVYDGYFIMEGCSNEIFYGAKYIKENDTVALDGERYRLYEEFLTESEKSELETLRSNYASIKQDLEKYQTQEANAAKDKILSNEVYSLITEEADFKELITNKENYSLEELETKADLLLAKKVKATKTFAVETKPESSNSRLKIDFEQEEPSEHPYGHLFDELTR